ncbi:Response regulator receiver protein [Anatilimnocola aggregata]|uniref:Response regulator receiver protein n=1 Tax=Anatilimnocola aggregata TaxID=2528021 RepID=A0A517Y7K2_9BACT|nr:response regulator [Anatilimnocola aggregata]QDU26211.1 Response regulator receiver protein [Anatilimnocola aggregata]
MNTKNSRLLIVDDEADTCANLADIFGELGFHVDTANHGVAALELVTTQPPYDIVLLDLRMPGMDGLELYRRIKQISAGTVALIVTAYASSDTAKTAIAAGARHVISKPVSIAKLIGLVESAMNSPLLLVVDDDHDLCDNLWDIFHRVGYRIHLAHDIDAASLTLQNCSFQVVLLDMKLPSGEGSSVLKVVRATNPQARTIVITGCANDQEIRVQQALREGAAAVAYKPFDVPVLLEMVTANLHPFGDKS